MKRRYEKPALVTRVAVLGVFGIYNIDPDGGGGDQLPLPVKIINDRRLHMD